MLKIRWSWDRHIFNMGISILERWHLHIETAPRVLHRISVCLPATWILSFQLYISALCTISKPWVNSNWSYSPETLNSCQNWQFFVPCALEIWQMTLKNKRALLLCGFKLCASFHRQWWIQTGVTVRKRPIWFKIDDFFSCGTLKFDGCPCKKIGHLF